MSISISIEDIDEVTAQWIYQEAEQRGMSVEMFVLQLIQKGISLERQEAQPQAYHDLDSLAGTWTEEQAAEFLKTIIDFEQIDEKLWQ